MIVHALVASFTSFLFVFLADPIELIPVEAGVEDRGALSDSLHVEQTNMRQDHAFEKLYKIAGSDDVYVRKSGGLSAVFRTSAYVQTPRGDVPIVPAGTVYYIGEIPPQLVQQLGELQEPLEPSSTLIIAEMAIPRVGTLSSKTPLTKNKTPRYSIEFLENETYRRQRLTSFVLDIVLLH